MENKGSTPGQVQGTIHGPGYSGGSGITAFDNLPSGQTFYSAYHVFAADWGANFVNFSVDGHVYASRTPADLPSDTTWAFNHPFDIILDIQEGGAFAGGPGPISTYPQTMLVDYVRAAVSPLSAVPVARPMPISVHPGQAGSSSFDGLAWTVQRQRFRSTLPTSFISRARASPAMRRSPPASITLLNTGTFAKAGIMIRDGTAANAALCFRFRQSAQRPTGGRRELRAPHRCRRQFAGGRFRSRHDRAALAEAPARWQLRSPPSILPMASLGRNSARAKRSR